MGLAGAVVGASYGASVILNKIRDPYETDKLREAVFGIPRRHKGTVEMEKVGNIYRKKKVVIT